MPEGGRFRAQAPFGGWQTQTFIAGLRCHGTIAPWIIDTPMNKTYVETQLAPELGPGDIVVLDKVAFHKMAAPPARPTSTRSNSSSQSSNTPCEKPWAEPSKQSGTSAEILTTIAPGECENYLATAGYKLTQMRNGLQHRTEYRIRSDAVAPCLRIGFSENRFALFGPMLWPEHEIRFDQPDFA